MTRYTLGQTANLDRRLKMHNDGTLGGYTSRFSGNWRVVYSEEVSTRTEALRREKQLKSYRGREFVRTNIPEN